MAGFRRLCGRFRCAAVRLVRVGQRARNKAFTAFAGDCGGAGGGSGSGEGCGPIRESEARGSGVFNGVYRPIKWRWRRPATEG